MEKPATAPTSSVEFLSGDSRRDRRSVSALLDEVGRISSRVAGVAGPEDLDELLTYIVDASVERTGAERGLLLLAEPEGEGHHVRVARREGRHTIRGGVRYSTSAIERVLRSGRPLRNRFRTSAEALRLGDSVDALELRALMCVPLDTHGSDGRKDGRPRGALYVDTKASEREFTHRDLSYFNALAQQIGVALRSVRLHLDSIERVRLDAALEVARVVQRDLMPHVHGRSGGLDVHGWYLPAGRTSGDFYDVFRAHDGRLCVVVGDVTGHGPASALITSAVQAEVRTALRLVADPVEALRHVNADLSERTGDDQFATLFVALLTTGGELEAINLGHPDPLIWRCADGAVEALTGHGPAIGMLPDLACARPARRKLRPGDVLLAYSDGLTEARSADRHDELFGQARLRARLAEDAPGTDTARELTDAIAHAGLAFAAGQRDDDLTVLVVRRPRARPPSVELPRAAAAELVAAGGGGASSRLGR